MRQVNFDAENTTVIETQRTNPELVLRRRHDSGPGIRLPAHHSEKSRATAAALSEMCRDDFVRRNFISVCFGCCAVVMRGSITTMALRAPNRPTPMNASVQRTNTDYDHQRGSSSHHYMSPSGYLPNGNGGEPPHTTIHIGGSGLQLMNTINYSQDSQSAVLPTRLSFAQSR